MATFSAKKLDLTKVNGGQEYEQGDFLQSDTINDVVEGTAYAQNVAEAANTNANDAVSTANSANSTANDASKKVDTFEQRITTAQNTADTAVSNAATAQGTADSATTEINKIKNGTTTVPNAQHAVSADNADLATKAKQDVNGNSIVDTYATKLEVTEAQGTKVYYGSALQTSVTFDSNPQTQITANKTAIAEAQSDINDIVSGAQTVGKAKTDQKGNVIDTTYAKLSQVVRTDTAQGLNSTQQLQAQKNIYPAVTDLNNVPLPFTICSQVFTFSVNTANAPTTDGGTLIQSVFDTASGGFFTQTAIMNTEGGGEIYTRRHNGAGGWTNWQRYMSIDPTTLTPSTANGWTQTTATGTLPSAGVYLVAATLEGVSSILSPCIMVFDGTNSAATSTVAAHKYTNIGYVPELLDLENKWFASDMSSHQAVTITNIYYKRIA